ncbi:hypothetical protein ACFX13_032147 [Malus domestica]
MEYALHFKFKASNNEAEYEALLAGLRLAKHLGVKRIDIFNNSQLVVNQVTNNFDAKDSFMVATSSLSTVNLHNQEPRGKMTHHLLHREKMPAIAKFTAEPYASAPGVDVGYGIAITVNILVIISAIMLACYVCVKVKGSTGRGHTCDATSNYYEDRNHRFSTISNSTEPVVVLMGLDDPIIDSYLKLVLDESQRLPQRNDAVCSICLSDYKPKDQVRCIPDCHHCFHAECVDEWLRMSTTCLVCRNSPAPSAGPSPLSDLVPLAFNARVFIFKSPCDLDSNFLMYAVGVVRTNNLQLSTTNF